MAGKDKENKSTGNIVSNIVNHIKASKEKKKMNVKLSGNETGTRYLFHILILYCVYCTSVH